MNLWECLRHEFLNNREFWNYYQADTVDPFVDEEQARNFIVGYLQSACKGKAIYEWERFEEADLRFRDTHVIYVFFIGAMLQYIIDPNLKIESSISEYDEGYKFSYLWFLTCMAHDLGYVYENRDIPNEIDEMKEVYNYYLNNTHSPWFYHGRCMIYRRFLRNIQRVSPSIPFNIHACFDKRRRREKNCEPCRRMCKGGLQYNNGTRIRRCWYTFGLKERYFRYRLFEMSKLDHGIVGADKFFSDMVETYYKNFEEKLDYGNFECFENSMYRRFSCEQFKVFAYIADCIAAHNIFREEDSESSRELYEKYGLQQLSQKEFVKISYSKNPLLFILCVADTLEPTKKFRELDSCEVFENIELDYDVENNCIHLKIREWLTEETGYEDYIKAANGLKEWCDITVQVEAV